MPGVFQLSINHAVEEAKRAYDLGIPAVLLFGMPDQKDEAASGAVRPRGHSPARHAGHKGRGARADRDHRRLPVRVHDHGHCGVVERGRRGRQRRDPRRCWRARRSRTREAGADIVAPSDMMDGRVARDPERAGRRRASQDIADPGVRRQVRLGVLRAVPRGGRERARLRRPARLPDGPGQRARGAARGRARRRGGGRHRDGQAGAGVPRHRRAGARSASTCPWRRTT